MNLLQKITVIISTFIFVACGGSEKSSKSPEKVAEKPVYGGVFKMPLTSFFICNSVSEIQKLETGQIYEQIFEGLVAYNPKTLEIVPSLAKSWSVSDDGLTYKFVLEDNVYFHDGICFEEGKGRKFVPEDVIYTFEKIYTNVNTGSGYSIFKNVIVGGEEFKNGTSEHISGITVDGNEVTFTLVKPSLTFLQKTATVYASIIAKEATEYEYFVPIGTGPFYYDFDNSNSEVVKLAKNNNYYGVNKNGDRLPYLDSVIFIYEEDTDTKMERFWLKDLAFIPEVPISKISEVLEERINDFKGENAKYILNSQPKLITTFLALNMQTPVFQNNLVRQAFTCAIDKNSLVNKILKDQAYESGDYGLVPPISRVFKGYDFDHMNKLNTKYNPEKARQYLADAGYPDGEGFPSVQFQFKKGTDEYWVASEIQRQLQNVLKINIDLQGVEFNELIENQNNGNGDIFRTNWVADYPSAESFLSKAYGKLVPEDPTKASVFNNSRYSNPEFDALFEKGQLANNQETANAYYSQAEAYLMEDAAFIALWYAEDMSLVQADLRNLSSNSISYLSLKEVFWTSDSLSNATAEVEK